MVWVAAHCTVFQQQLWILQADVATVLRKGRLHVVPASQLVPGDIVEVAGQTTCPASINPFPAPIFLPALPYPTQMHRLIRQHAVCYTRWRPTMN